MQAVSFRGTIDMQNPTAQIFASNLLVSAARLQELETVRALISLGADVNTSPDRYTQPTALYEAVNQQDIHIVQALLQAGADLTAGFGVHYGISVFRKAISGKNNRDLVRLLLSTRAGAALVASSLGSMVLLDAVIHGDPGLVQVFLAAKAPLNPEDMTSMTALQAAAKGNNIEVVQILLDAGANVNVPAGQEFEIAAKKAIRTARYDNLVSPIQYAASQNNTEMVQMLLDLGAQVDGFILNDENIDFDKVCIEKYPIVTPLQLAVKHENAVLVRLLLARGANIEGPGYCK